MRLRRRFLLLAALAAAARAGTPGGNYVVFEHLTEPGGFIVRAEEGSLPVGNQGRAPINAVQLVRNEILVVTTALDENDPTGTPGTGLSLREALRDAPAGAGIVFDPAVFNGEAGDTITLGSEIVLGKNVTIDASSLPAGVTISGGGTSRIFTLSDGQTVALRNLTLTGGNGAGAASSGSGGAIRMNGGLLTLLQCTLSGNSGTSGGAIYNDDNGILSLTQCTVAGNSSGDEGGAIRNRRGMLSLTHCTLAGNSARFLGGAIYNEDSLTLDNSIIAGNSAPDGMDLYNDEAAVTLLGANVVPSLFNQSGTITGTGTRLSIDPLLAPLGHYGGPTPTMALLPGSPARFGKGPGAIPNPSFEADTFTTFPGASRQAGNGTITGWTLSAPDNSGLNPAGGSPFADNGATPDGLNVAFLQSFSGNPESRLATTITALQPGATYTVSFRANRRTGGPVGPEASWSLDGGAFVAFDVNPAVGGANAYRTVTGSFTATAPTASLVIRCVATTDETLLVDDFTIAPVASLTTTDQRGFPLVGLPDLGAYEAGTLNNYNAWIWELLPANATAAQHAASFDFDGDGVSNGAEFAAGTDPLVADNPDVSFSITSVVRNADGSLTLSFPTVAGRSYTLLQADTPAGPFLSAGTGAGTDAGVTVVAGNGATRTITVIPANVPARYFRLRATP